MTRSVTLLFVAVCVLCPTRISAQSAERVSLEGSLGAARAVTGIPFTSSGSLAMDAILSFRAKRSPGGSLVAGATASRFYVGGADASCQVLPDDSCAPSPPNLWLRSIVLGWEATSRIGESARLMLGPAWFQQDYRDTVTVGLQSRLDLSTHMTGRFAFLISGRWSHLPSFRERALNYFAFGVGFRLRVM